MRQRNHACTPLLRPAPGAHRNGKREFNLVRNHCRTLVIALLTDGVNRSLCRFRQPGKPFVTRKKGSRLSNPLANRRASGRHECEKESGGRRPRRVRVGNPRESVVTGRYALHYTQQPITTLLLLFIYLFLATSPSAVARENGTRPNESGRLPDPWKASAACQPPTGAMNRAAEPPCRCACPRAQRQRLFDCDGKDHNEKRPLDSSPLSLQPSQPRL